MPVCFFITAIGERGSEIRKNADYLQALILEPVLEFHNVTVVRGDHRSESGQIDMDVIRAVQEADLCIADLSLPNPNVYYELGRRDETGKPLILLKAKGSDKLPVDIATRRYIEYDLDDKQSLIDARKQLKEFVEPIVKNSFESGGTGTSLSELAEILRRVERKIDRFGKPGTATATTVGTNIDANNTIEDTDPKDLLKYALRQRNIPLAEQAMNALSVRMNHHRWLDQVVEQVAAIGSTSAGDLLIENAFDFIDNTESFEDKVDYVGCLVSNLNQTDREQENLQLVEQLCAALKAISDQEDTENRIRINNQLNRLYYGVYCLTDEKIWLEKAIKELEEALEISEAENYLHYNLATCLRGRNESGDIEAAIVHVLRCIELDREEDDMDSDHIELACKLMHAVQDERTADYLDMLEQVNPIKAKLLRSDWKL